MPTPTPGFSMDLLLAGLTWLLNIYSIVLIVRVIFSWIRLPSTHPVMRTFGPVIYGLTEPLLKPIRAWLAPYQRNSPIDFSVLILWLILQVLLSLLRRFLA